MQKLIVVLGLLVAVGVTAIVWTPSRSYDIVIRHGTVYDGSGEDPVRADIGIRGDSIVAVGPNLEGEGSEEIDAGGLAVAPGFINMLSWANESLIADGRSQSDIRQGVTLEVMGEGWSMGPLNDQMKTIARAEEGDIQYEIQWTTLGEYLDFLEKRGIATNVASFVGATTVRIHELGSVDRAPTSEELGRMKDMVRQAMEEGAMGVGSSLIYAPAFYARTDELWSCAGLLPRMAECTSRTSGAKGISSCRLSMNSFRLPVTRRFRRKSITSRPQGSRTGTHWTLR